MHLLLGKFIYKDTHYDSRCYISINLKDQKNEIKNETQHVKILKFGKICVFYYTFHTNDLNEFCSNMNLKLEA